MYLFLAVFLTLFVTAPLTAGAATLQVCGTCSYTSLAPAAAAANNGDTIYVGPGTYPGATAVFDKVNVTVIGGGVGITTLKMNADPMVEVKNGAIVDFSDLTFQAPPFSGSGNGYRCLNIRDPNTVANVSNSSFIDCKRRGWGGAVRVDDKNATFNATNVLFDGNEAWPKTDTTNGMGAHIYSIGVVTLAACTLKNGKAIQGGAIYLQANAGTVGPNTWLTISNGTLFDNNQAISFDGGTDTPYGGAIVALDTSANDTKRIHVFITNTTFQNHITDGNGGALHLLQPTAFTISNSSFIDNRAGASGGDIWLYGAANAASTFSITDTSFTTPTLVGNTAVNGGHLYLTSTSLGLAGVTVNDGQASSKGGGLYVGDAGAVTLTAGTANSSFSGNIAIDGGAIFANATSSPSLSVTDTDFTANHAVSDGGGIYVNNPISFDITRGSFTDNRANTNGGSLRLAGAGSYTITDTVFDNSPSFTGDSASQGGHLWLSTGVDMLLAGVTINDGATSNNGGGVYVTSAATNLTVQSSAANNPLFSGNTAGTDGTGAGGALDVQGGTLSITNTVFDTNSAQHGGHLNTAVSVAITGGSLNAGSATGDGGAIRATSNATLSLTGVTLTNHSATRGGAIMMTDAGNLTLDNTTSDSATASNAGGHIWANHTTTGRTVTLQNGTRLANGSATTQGGAIYAGDRISVAITGANNALLPELDTNTAATDGGAIFVKSTANGLSLTSAVFANNTTAIGDGGAVAINAPISWAPDLCSFSNNAAAAGNGGAIAFASASGSPVLTLTNSSFDANSAGLGGGAIHLSGTGSLIATDNSFVSNAATDGGAWHLNTISDLQATRNLFCTNAADDLTSAGDGGAVWMSGGGAGSSILTNNSFVENGARVDGGALFLSATQVNVVHNHFLSNGATGLGGAARITTSTTDFRNNLVAFTVAGDGLSNNASSFSLGYNAWTLNTSSNVSGSVSVPGTGAIFPADAMALKLTAYSADGNCANDSLWPQTSSPLIDAGDQGSPTDLDGSRADIGAFGGQSSDPNLANDLDGDGYTPLTGDCVDDPALNPLASSIHPGAIELPVDGIDQNCDGLEDCYTDGDLDGEGTTTLSASSNLSCSSSGVSNTNTDCDDNDPTRATTFSEITADGIDNNCDTLEACYTDADGDNWGVPVSSSGPLVLIDAATLTCTTAPNAAANTTDCVDDPLITDAALIHPTATEIVGDEIDQDCNSEELCYVDSDGDGHGDDTLNTTVVSSLDLLCRTADNESTINDDCDDTLNTIHPGTIELVGDGIDQNCDGAELCFVDTDGDTYGDATPNISVFSPDSDCLDPGESMDNTDCNDANGGIHPTAAEIIANGIDEDCDTKDACYTDADNDDWGVPETVSTPLVLVPVAANACTNAANAAPNPGDCDDNAATVNPGANERAANGIDDDCDTFEACYVDNDGDTHGDATQGLTIASADLVCTDIGESTVNDDCDDNDANSFPTNAEITANGVDNDCNGLETCYIDADLDTYGNLAGVTVNNADLSCSAPGISSNASDCDDNATAVNPGANEIAANGADDNCNGFEACYIDSDGDGHGDNSITDPLISVQAGGLPDDDLDLTCTALYLSTVADDCDDTVVTTYTGALENIGDGVDQDCDGGDTCYVDGDGDTYGTDLGTTLLSVNLSCTDNGESPNKLDCDDGDPSRNPTTSWYIDIDGDSFGNPAVSLQQCAQPVNYVLDNTDCDDSNATINPATIWYLDNDGDGFGDPSTQVISCSAPNGYVLNNTDCNDFNPLLNPDTLWFRDLDGDTYGDPANATSACLQPSGYVTDNHDCNDADPNAGVGTTLYLDADGDGFGDASQAAVDCGTTLVGYVADNTDCDDGRALTNPNASEFCNLFDDNCDGVTDEATAQDARDWFFDGDGDGFGLATTRQHACYAPTLFVAQNGDCDDQRTATYPGAFEVCNDGIWQDCVYVVAGLDPLQADADADGVTYGDELFSGASDCLADSDGDGVSDGIEFGLDTDGDGIFDIIDTDDDGDGLPTFSEEATDTDGDGRPDYLDTDDDNDGLLTIDERSMACETGPSRDDCDGDGVKNWLDNDDDNDGVPTDAELEGGLTSPVCEGNTVNANDCDGDGVFNWVDTDDDGDGVPTSVESSISCDGTASDQNDCDGDGYLNWVDLDDDGDGLLTADEQVLPCEGGVGDNCDGDGFINAFDLDDDGDGIPTTEETSANGTAPPCDGNPTNVDDCDGDGAVNWVDTDDDGDGVPSANERGLSCVNSGDDCDGDGIANWWDLDDDGDSVNTAVELASCTANGADCDGDGVDNWLDIDDDGDGVPTDEERVGGAPFTDPLCDPASGAQNANDCDRDGVDNWLDIDDDDDAINSLDEISATCDGGGTSFISDDCDGDGIPNWYDTDDDGDGLSTFEEGDGESECGNPDGLPNYLDLDSDGDGASDAEESTTLPRDRDGDGINNEVDCYDEGCAGDRDGDGVDNCVEEALGMDPSSPDSDGDGVEDGLEIGDLSGANPTDTDGDGIIDALDTDDDNDGLSTDQELIAFCADGLPATYCLDLTTPGVCDLDPTLPVGWSCSDGSVEGLSYSLVDTDNDGKLDYVDDDDDNDGTPTRDEDINHNGDYFDDDSDGDGVPDYLDNLDADGPLGDLDADGLTNAEEDMVGSDPLLADTDDDGVMDADEVGDDLSHPQDTDGDGNPDVTDPDDDGDGLSTREEGDGDWDQDGIPDYLDPDQPDTGEPDVDGDGVPQGEDCDDNDASVYPGADEQQDAIDHNCDGFSDRAGTRLVPRPCGCQTSGPAGGLWVWLLLVALVRRREVRP